MITRTRRAPRRLCSSFPCQCSSGPPGHKSAAAAKQLTDALDAAKLDAIAAADPSDPATFVAALYIQGSQLLVVSAKYAAPPLLTAKLKTKEYRDIYMDLAPRRSRAARSSSST